MHGVQCALQNFKETEQDFDPTFNIKYLIGNSFISQPSSDPKHTLLHSTVLKQLNFFLWSYTVFTCLHFAGPVAQQECHVTQSKEGSYKHNLIWIFPDKSEHYILVEPVLILYDIQDTAGAARRIR